MSNINCHRRKIIYSVRTPITALQSWIIRRIHTSMDVFDDIETNELGPRPYARNPTSSPQRHRLAREFRQFEVPLRREKFEAMVKLGVANSRMKDFYDLQVLSSRLAFDGKTLGLTKIHLPFSVFAAIYHDSHDTYMTPNPTDKSRDSL
jgi:hypothetical protein